MWFRADRNPPVSPGGGVREMDDAPMTDWLDTSVSETTSVMMAWRSFSVVGSARPGSMQRLFWPLTSRALSLWVEGRWTSVLYGSGGVTACVRQMSASSLCVKVSLALVK